ncbi:SMI1/KNR4 family protein, partial [Streptomyces sp. NPDC059766]|uniref:SMI1/KNR4 family protein n=1 Tax=Streptomyces sp. NPDC059766 TaxID=3346940 RepID=UPI00365C68F6
DGAARSADRAAAGHGTESGGPAPVSAGRGDGSGDGHDCGGGAAGEARHEDPADLGGVSVNGDVERDWQSLEDRAGIEFPDDYKRFVSAYGSGCLNDQLPRSAGLSSCDFRRRCSLRGASTGQVSLMSASSDRARCYRTF